MDTDWSTSGSRVLIKAFVFTAQAPVSGGFFGFRKNAR